MFHLRKDSHSHLHKSLVKKFCTGIEKREYNFVVLIEFLTSVWGRPPRPEYSRRRAALANLSASSFPWIPTWLGIQRNEISFPWQRALWASSWILVILGSVLQNLSRESKQDNESVSKIFVYCLFKGAFDTRRSYKRPPHTCVSFPQRQPFTFT